MFSLEITLEGLDVQDAAGQIISRGQCPLNTFLTETDRSQIIY